MICPNCQSKEVRRSMTTGWERFSRVLFAVKQFRCRDCNSRWTASVFDIREDSRTLLIWTMIITIVGLCVLGLVKVR